MIRDSAGKAQANSGKKPDGLMSETVRVRHAYADRRRGGMRVLYRQYPGEEEESVQLAIALIQGKWKIGILFGLERQPVRLSQLRRMFPQASKKMLTQHLREMERDGLIVRTDLSGRLRHVEYSLSDSLGFAVLQLINALTEWGSRYTPSLLRSEAVRTLAETIDFGPRNCESSSLRLKEVLLGSR
jgi:DNA-binding HxlR family transcriptional regulator